MTDQHAQDDLSVARDVYEHLHRVYQTDEAAHTVFLEKVHRLMTVQGLIFAAIAYALGEISRTPTQKPLDSWVLCVAALAAISLSTGFVCAIACLSPEEVPAVGVRGLEKLLKSGDISRLDAGNLFRDLAVNVAVVINENRSKIPRRRTWARVLTWSTLCGFVLGALFIAAAIGKRVTTATESETSMPKDQETIVNEKPQPDGTAAVPTSVPSPIAQVGDRPSAVEPPELIVRGNPPRPSACEPPQLIVGKDTGKPTERRAHGKLG